MLTTHRKKFLLDRLGRDGQIVAKALSAELGLSEDTIRRDLRELAAEGKLQRVHGGALPASAAVGDIATRARIATADKQALGRAGAAMLQDGQVVLIDGGTTAIQLARHLSEDLRATFITHSPQVALELATKPHLEIIMLGGRLFRHSMVNVGTSVIEAVNQLRADIYFMGVTGVHASAGLSTGDYEEAAIKRGLYSRASETVVLASPEKLGAASSFIIARLHDIATLVVPGNTPLSMTADLQTSGVHIVYA
jgi:DeoR/GlpR family transcriptional regulator of sugar metabolism